MSNFNPQIDTEKMLHAYILDHLKKKQLHETARIFQAEAGVSTNIPVHDMPQGFLREWWCVYRDLDRANKNLPSSEPAVAYWQHQQQKQQQQQRGCRMPVSDSKSSTDPLKMLYHQEISNTMANKENEGGKNVRDVRNCALALNLNELPPKWDKETESLFAAVSNIPQVTDWFQRFQELTRAERMRRKKIFAQDVSSGSVAEESIASSDPAGACEDSGGTSNELADEQRNLP